MDLRQTIRTLGEVKRSLSRTILRCLDWFVAIAERLIVLGVVGVAFHFGYKLYCGKLSSADSQYLPLVAQNWKIVFLLLVPLFYQTIRTFLEEVQEIYGMTRHKKGAWVNEKNLRRRANLSVYKNSTPA